MHAIARDWNTVVRQNASLVCRFYLDISHLAYYTCRYPFGIYFWFLAPNYARLPNQCCKIRPLSLPFILFHSSYFNRRLSLSFSPTVRYHVFSKTRRITRSGPCYLPARRTAVRSNLGYKLALKSFVSMSRSFRLPTYFFSSVLARRTFSRLYCFCVFLRLL